MKSRFLIGLLFCGGMLCAQSPLRVRNDLSIDHLVNKIFLAEQSGIEVSNVTYKGSQLSLGAFSNASKYYLIKRGLILSTGNVEHAMGPNEYENMGLYLGRAGDPELEEIATGRTYDAAVFSLEFTSDADSIAFNYVFASDEYPEYVDQGVNDIFAFFLEDLSTGIRKNLAVVGSENKEVNVDNINHFRSQELYIQNGVWDPGNVMKWADDPGLGELALTYEYDGFTTLLSAGHRIQPGRRYRISFAIADVGDGVYDSAVFLEANSFRSESTEEIAGTPQLEELKSEIAPNMEWRKGQGGYVLILPVNFDFDQDQITADSSLQVLNRIASLLKENPHLKLVVSGHTDNFGSEDYNKDLSQRRANYALNYLEQQGAINSMEAIGEGDSRPVSDNVTKRGRLKNRRIEFEFRY